MDRPPQCGCAGTRRTARSVLLLAGMAAIVSLRLVACSSARRPVIGVIPQTDGTMIWEAAHVGAEAAARQAGTAIYWNAPTREDDVEAQIALVEQVVDRGYQGLVLAPDQALSLISPVRRALAHGIPTVIIGSPLPIPAGGGLFYIVNDDAAAGRMAAERLATLLHGRGTVAVLGIDPDFMGIMTRERGFEEYLDQHDPDIHIVSRQMGSFNGPRQQQIAEATLSSHPGLDAIVALISPSVDATLAALASMPNRQPVRVIGFDVSGLPPFDGNPGLDCVIQENTRLMGQKAVEDIELARRGAPVPLELSVPPVMITRANIGTAAVRWMFSQDWTLGRWTWSSSR